MPLSDTAIRNAKPQEKPWKLFDEHGLYMEVRPHGGKWWRLKYRHDGKEKGLSLGIYPDVSLKLARERRAEARTLLATGVDPSASRKAVKTAKAGRAANSFEVATREWFAEHSKRWVPRHAVRVLRLFERDLLPWLGAIPIAEVTAADLLSTLRRIDERSANDTAHRARQSLGQVFRYAVATGRAAGDPSAALKGAIAREKGGHFAAVTDPAMLGPLLRLLHGYGGSLTVRCALRLTPLVILRPKELREGEWSELDFEQALWNIPAERMKMGVAHSVPLSRQAAAILRELQSLTGNGKLIFPSARGATRPISDMAVNAAMKTVGISGKVMTGHGFRATARTILDEVLGFRPDFIEHQLAHAVRDPNGRAYNRTAHLEERRKMMQAWADYLDKLRTEPGAIAGKGEPRLVSA